MCVGGGGRSRHSRIKVGGKGVPGIQTQQVGVWGGGGEGGECGGGQVCVCVMGGGGPLHSRSPLGGGGRECKSLHTRIKGGVKGVPGIQTQQVGVRCVWWQ